MKFYSQLGQDSFVLENFFRGRRGGVFVDIGAYDGATFSNTLFFERSMGWTGLCVEPLPSAFARLKTIRRAACEQICVANFDGEAEFLEVEAGVDEKMLSGLAGSFDPRHIARLTQVATQSNRFKVPVTRASNLFAKHGLFQVDYCSIDTEGAEFSILSDLDFDRFHISVFTVENNYDDERIPRLMQSKGYDIAGQIEQDYVFRRRDAKLLPRISVICAVPRDEPRRHGLLEAHAANLARQTVPVAPIYVFEAGDPVPAWLQARAVSCGAGLTRYQAWNVALALVDTPFVMTLNLADRLAPDAVERLEAERQKTDAIGVHGVWKRCRDQTEAEAVELCHPLEDLPEGLRLGAGRGPQDVPAPSLLWRMDAHLRAPRYPWRFRDGTALESLAEIAWRAMLVNAPRQALAFAPFIVGNAVSESTPRGLVPSEEQRARLSDPGISLL